jgi:hypothetical protein
MDVWLMTDPTFWVTLGAWSGFCIGLFTGAVMTWWYCHSKSSSVFPDGVIQAPPHLQSTSTNAPL